MNTYVDNLNRTHSWNEKGSNKKVKKISVSKFLKTSAIKKAFDIFERTNIKMHTHTLVTRKWCIILQQWKYKPFS